jgi:hypothetical protein
MNSDLNSLDRLKKCGDTHIAPWHLQGMDEADSQALNNLSLTSLSKTNAARALTSILRPFFHAGPF